MPDPALHYREEQAFFFDQGWTPEHTGAALGYGIVLLVVLLVAWLKPGEKR